MKLDITHFVKAQVEETGEVELSLAELETVCGGGSYPESDGFPYGGFPYQEGCSSNYGSGFYQGGFGFNYGSGFPYGYEDGSNQWPPCQIPPSSCQNY